MARFPPPSAMVMNVKKIPKARHVSLPLSHGVESYSHTGVNNNWSNATLFKAGAVLECFTRGNVRDRNEYQLCCNGARRKPYAMKRVKRSKSKGGGRRRGSIVMLWLKGFFLSSSWNSIAKKSSSVPPFCFRAAFCRIAVMDWATVSAIPPRTCI